MNKSENIGVLKIKSTKISLIIKIEARELLPGIQTGIFSPEDRILYFGTIEAKSPFDPKVELLIFISLVKQPGNKSRYTEANNEN